MWITLVLISNFLLLNVIKPLIYMIYNMQQVTLVVEVILRLRKRTVLNCESNYHQHKYDLSLPIKCFPKLEALC